MVKQEAHSKSSKRFQKEQLDPSSTNINKTFTRNGELRKLLR